MRDGTMFITNQEFVPYTNPDCALGFLCTLKVEYSHEITLDPDEFNHPEGYVIVWERCCRNWDTKNLINPGWNGMTYTLYFPPVVDASGKPFVNSSHKLCARSLHQVSETTCKLKLRNMVNSCLILLFSLSWLF